MARAFAAFEEHRVKLDDDDSKKVNVRSDTRIYFGDQPSVRPVSGKCIGAFFLQNPGSASPALCGKNKGHNLYRWPWGEVCYDREDLIPLVIGVLDDVLTRVRRKNHEFAGDLRRDGYVQLLNLTYVKNATDFREAMKFWKRLSKTKRCHDDVPDADKHFRFLVFGWGTVYEDRLHGERVARMLASYLPCNTQLVFPTRSSVTERIRIATERACGTAEEIRLQIGHPACYPCGGLHERRTFPEVYQRALSSCLARILLKN